MKYEWRKQEKELYGVKQSCFYEMFQAKVHSIKGQGNQMKKISQINFRFILSGLWYKMLFKKAAIEN